jgi:hypothetical protein
MDKVYYIGRLTNINIWFRAIDNLTGTIAPARLAAADVSPCDVQRGAAPRRGRAERWEAGGSRCALELNLSLIPASTPIRRMADCGREPESACASSPQRMASSVERRLPGRKGKAVEGGLKSGSLGRSTHDSHLDS